MIACRARKDQKAKLTRLVRKGNREVVTLAIGDGANDVEMIRTAHIGVGVIGKEGTQAVNNADYAIGQFRFLTRLILIYGHRNYRGITLASLLIFYKNILFTLIQYLYTFICGLSGTRNQSYIAIFWYNTALTAFGPLLLAIFDRDLSDTNCYRFPQIHRQGIEHRLFSVKQFLVYLLKAIWEAVAIFTVLVCGMAKIDFPVGTVGVWMFGLIAVTVNIMVANLSASIEQSTMYWLSIVAFWGTFIFWLILVFSISRSYSLQPLYYYSVDLLLGNGYCVLLMILAVVVAILPTMIVKALKRECRPTLSQFIQDVQVRDADPQMVKKALEDMEKKRSLELELKTMKSIPQEAKMPELMVMSEEALISAHGEEAMKVEETKGTDDKPISPYALMKTGNAQRSIRSMAGLRALTVCSQLHGPSYDSQSINSEAQNELISKINSHNWRSSQPDLMVSLKSTLREATPLNLIRKVSDTLKKADEKPKMLLSGKKKMGLSVVTEEDEEEEVVEMKKNEGMREVDMSSIEIDVKSEEMEEKEGLTYRDHSMNTPTSIQIESSVSVDVSSSVPIDTSIPINTPTPTESESLSPNPEIVPLYPDMLSLDPLINKRTQK